MNATTIETRKQFFTVFINDAHNEHLVLDESASFEAVREARLMGYSEVWDSAPSAFEAAKFASEQYGCPVPCIVGEKRQVISPLTAAPLAETRKAQ